MWIVNSRLAGIYAGRSDTVIIFSTLAHGYFVIYVTQTQTAKSQRSRDLDSLLHDSGRYGNQIIIPCILWYYALGSVVYRSKILSNI